MHEKYWQRLESEECCFTCRFNDNAYKRECKCNCKYSLDGMYAQEIWCSNYELVIKDDKIS